MEKTFTCSDDFQLAAQCYNSDSDIGNDGKKNKKKILMLHGWLDNCRSFWKLAPALAANANPEYEVVALDLPGHGLSGHRPKQAPSIMLPEGVYYVAEVLHQLEWVGSGSTDTGKDDKSSSKNSKVTLIGHSMGAAISLAYAAAFPDHMDRLILLEGVGPISKPDDDVTQHLRRHVESRLKGNTSMYGPAAKNKGPRLHASLEAAIETRMKTATLSPGNQYISKEAATELVTRSARRANSDKDDEAVQFLHDYRLYWPSLMYMTPTQVSALHQAVRDIPTCVLLAQDGWPFDEVRLESVKERMQPNQLTVLPGSHHFHADPDTAELVREHIVQFLQEYVVASDESEE